MGVVNSSSVVVDTAAETAQPSPVAKTIMASLIGLGYAVSVNSRNVLNIADLIDGQKYNIVAIVDEEKNQISINCHVASLGDFSEEDSFLRNYFFALVNMNDVIAPFATSIITSEDDSSVENPKITLVNCWNLLSEETNASNLKYQMDSLRKAVVYYRSQIATLLTIK